MSCGAFADAADILHIIGGEGLPKMRKGKGIVGKFECDFADFNGSWQSPESVFSILQ